MPDEKGPAIIDDTLPGGPRWMHNLGDQPVWVETKTQYKQELAARGLVQVERGVSNKRDTSPWATKTRLKTGHDDPFLPKDQPHVAPSDLPGSGGSQERTVAEVGEDHQRAQGIQLSIDQLRTIRAYGRWCHDAGLRPDRYCQHCFGGMLGDPMQCKIALDDVIFVCSCTVRFGHAETHLPPAIPPPVKHHIIEFPFASQDVPLGQAAADLLRHYKRVLSDLGIMETLWCDACRRNGDEPGVEAFVGSKTVRLKCRCMTRIHVDS